MAYQSIPEQPQPRLFATYSEAVDALPGEAEWSSSFGNAGEGGCAVYFRAPDGRRWSIGNGSYSVVSPFVWTVQELA